MKMKIKLYKIGLILAILSCIIPLSQEAQANGGGGYGKKRHGHSHYKHYRYYPDNYYYNRKVYYYPRRSYYYYYDVYPDKAYYYDWEKGIRSVNPEYLPVTSIANMASQGVPDAVIIAEIDRTRSSYKLDSATIAYLKQNNVSDAVIDYMIQSVNKYKY